MIKDLLLRWMARLNDTERQAVRWYFWDELSQADIAGRLGAELTNPAVNGYTTEDLIRDELPLFRTLQPDLVTVLIGVNDLVQGRTPDAYRTSLRTIYDELKDARVVAVSIPTWSYVPAAAGFGGADHVDRLTGAFNEVARQEADARGYRWIDVGPASISGIGAFSSGSGVAVIGSVGISSRS